MLSICQWKLIVKYLLLFYYKNILRYSIIYIKKTFDKKKLKKIKQFFCEKNSTIILIYKKVNKHLYL